MRSLVSAAMALCLQRISAPPRCLCHQSYPLPRLLSLQRHKAFSYPHCRVVLFSTSGTGDAVLKVIRLKNAKELEKTNNSTRIARKLPASGPCFIAGHNQQSSVGLAFQGSVSPSDQTVTKKRNSIMASMPSLNTLNNAGTLNTIEPSPSIHDTSESSKQVESSDKSSVRTKSTDQIDTMKKKNVSRGKKSEISSSKSKGNVSLEISEKKKSTDKEPSGKISKKSSPVASKCVIVKDDHKIKTSTSTSKAKKGEEVGVKDDIEFHVPVKTLKASKAKASSFKIAQTVPTDDTHTFSASPIRSWTKRSMKQPGPLHPPTGKSVVVVESLTKANTIQNFLGDMFVVLPSCGHVRHLAARSGSVRPDDDFSMVWEVPSTAWTYLTSIKVALNGAVNLILATDPDREGEAIAWHIAEMLHQQDALQENTRVARVVFHEITASAIIAALQCPRHISMSLVNAYLARTALDYLIGFNVSPILWKKLPGCQSAGRVQSAALALVCDREDEIERFKAQEYWTIEAESCPIEIPSLNKSVSLHARLTHFGSKKLQKFSIKCQDDADSIQKKVGLSNFTIADVQCSPMHRNPLPPYITSTLQQDAANKLSFSASYTMKLAQKLYEGVPLNGKATGLITYIRTDGFHISVEAANSILSLASERYGQNFASKSIRKYLKKVKNAQEAHEAIRPTDIWRLPSSLLGVLDDDSLKLYTLVWCRALACQMEPAIFSQMQINFSDADASMQLHSSCATIKFLGYQAVYKDEEAILLRQGGGADVDQRETDLLFSSLKRGEQMSFTKVQSKQHFTEPPPRYSEGTLVSKLEELGIGRPSTYASILKVLQDRTYVTVKSHRLFPEFRGRMVSAFLSHYFPEVTQYNFTSDIETELDNVSAGLTEWRMLLNTYWAQFSSYCDKANKVEIRKVEQMLEENFHDQLFSFVLDKSKTCPSCLEGTLIFKVSRHGSGYFIGCDHHPKCSYIAKTVINDGDDDDVCDKPDLCFQPKYIGLHPTSNEKILLKNGPYGFYVQLGEDRKGFSPKRASLAQIKDAESLSLEDALKLLQYPKTLGVHPDDKKPIILKISKYGFSVKHSRTSAPVPKFQEVDPGGMKSRDLDIEKDRKTRLCNNVQHIKPDDVTIPMAIKYLTGKHAKHIGRPKSNEQTAEA